MQRAPAQRPDVFRLEGPAAQAYLECLSTLLGVARPSALFPGKKAVADWLHFLGRERPRGGVAPVDVHLASGLPTRRLLTRLLAHQRATRTFLAAHHAKARRGSSSFHVALAAAELPPLQETTARLMKREGKASRLLLQHDALSSASGLLMRVTVELTQASGRHVTVTRGDVCEPLAPLCRAMASSASAGAASVVEALECLEGLRVHEATACELGPFVFAGLPAPAPGSACAVALRSAVREPGAGVLCLVLERVGESVPLDRCVDPWGEAPALTAAHRAGGRSGFRERKLVCTPGLVADVKSLVAATGVPCLVRSR